MWIKNVWICSNSGEKTTKKNIVVQQPVGIVQGLGQWQEKCLKNPGGMGGNKVKKRRKRYTILIKMQKKERKTDQEEWLPAENIISVEVNLEAFKATNRTHVLVKFTGILLKGKDFSP